MSVIRPMADRWATALLTGLGDADLRPRPVGRRHGAIGRRLNRAPAAPVIQVTCRIRVPKDGTMSLPGLPLTTAMLRADELTVVHHDDTVSHFTDVTYTLTREGLRVLTASGDEKAFTRFDILTTHARLAHRGLAA